MGNTRAENQKRTLMTNGTGKGKLAQAVSANKAATMPDWGRIDDQLLFRLIQTATADDGAVMFGYSRDGGTYCIKVYEDGEAQKFYEHSDEAITQVIVNIIEVLRG